ncbi:replication factor C large subunit [Candidatus Woesearchaeota archaeon]|nr:replication factor C large subunit [Candidatus Woesearchaeota archaeon]
MEPWTVKYRPKSSSEIQGQDSKIAQLKKFIDNYKKTKKKAALIYGPPGSGKTSAVHSLANELNFEILEINASDVRNKSAIKEKLGPAIFQQSLFSKGKLILIDEIDGLSGRKDRGGVSEILKLMKKSSFPIVLTANDPYDRKLKSIRKKSELVEFGSLNYRSVKNVLKKICYKEKINYDDLALTSLARRAGGDLRGAINDLQILTEHNKRLKSDDVRELSDRKQTESIINALVKVFKSRTPSIALSAYNDVEEDYDTILLWLDENLPREYKKPKDLSRAYDCISLADVYRGRIIRRQHWRFLVYVNQLLSVGIAISKDEKYKKFTKYRPTTRLLKIWRANMKKKKLESVSEKLAEKTHTSSKRVLKDTLPYIRLIFKKNKILADRISKELDLQKPEIKRLKR